MRWSSLGGALFLAVSPGCGSLVSGWSDGLGPVSRLPGGAPDAADIADAGGDGGASDAGRDGGASDAGRDGGATDAGRDGGATDAGRDGGAGADAGLRWDGGFSLAVQPSRPLSIRIATFPYPAEITPLTLRNGDGSRTYVLSTSFSLVCRDPSVTDPLFSPVSLAYSGCTLASRPALLASVNAQGTTTGRPPAQVPAYQYNLSYDGILGATVTDAPGGGKRIVFVRHNEHQYIQTAGYTYPSTVFPPTATNVYDPIACPARYVTTDAGTSWHNCWQSFAQFVSLAWAPFDPATGVLGTVVDEGPILWPTKSYRDSLGNSTGGMFYQPTLFLNPADGYLYVFFQTAYDNTEDGELPSLNRYGCIGVARAPAASADLRTTWRYYHRGSFSQPTLPAGFTAGNLAAFLDPAHPGGLKSCVLNTPTDRRHWSVWFHVARVRGTPFFAGVESRALELDAGQPGWDAWEMNLRVSPDLVHWTEGRRLDFAPGGWGGLQYEYPVLHDRTSSTNLEVDHADFWVLGKNATGGPSGYGLNGLRLSLQLAGYAVPPTLSREERLVRHYYDAVLGWPNMPIDDPNGVAWHVARFHSGESCAQVLTRFLDAPGSPWKTSAKTDTDYVNLMYQALTMRAADQAGLTYWLSTLSSGTYTRDTLVAAFGASAEADGVCRRGSR